MFRKLALASFFGLASVIAADAQTGSRITIEQNPSGARQEGNVRVQASTTFFMAGPTGDSEEAVKLRDRARRIVYEMAGKECDLLRDTLAKDCRLESINTTVGRQFGPQQAEGFQVNGSMNLQITLK